ncbi:MAG TPA: HyaD/HybD family hydrogenase maturation endopeptidase [Kofleriaceae bacterium]|nr:HyaD/HybD family hydrogenase maturation endopeptidase [Kofleriaceae bacterium]
MTTAPSSETERIPILVLGLGNVLCGDDGAGVAAVHRLRQRYAIPERVRVVDGGTLGLDLLALIAASDRVILVDAVRADGPPGTQVRITGDDVAPTVYERLSVHQIGVADVLAGAALCERYPAEVVILGIVPATTDLLLGCTPPVAAGLDELVERIVAELARLGVESPRRASTAPPDEGARALGL